MTESTNSITSLPKLRVLVVENLVESRQITKDNLIRWGYEPVVAEVVGEELITSAKRLARARCCHVALVDKRLMDDYDSRDTSGLGLIEALKPTETIILTAYPDHPTTRAALQADAFDVVAKQGGPQPLKEALARVAEEVWHRREIEWVRPVKFESASLMRQFFPDDPSKCPDEIDDALRRLFPRAKRLRLEPVGGSDQSPNPRHRRNSLVFQVYEDNHAHPVIVKVTKAGRVLRERSNWELAKNYLSTFRITIVDAYVVLWNLGGLVYRFIGKTGQAASPLTCIYRNPRFRNEEFATIFSGIYHILADLSSVVPAKHENGQAEIIDFYRKLWTKCSSTACTLELSHPFSFGEFRSIPDLCTWIDAHFPNRFRDLRMGIIHGELNADNILIDDRNDPWLIDFDSTGPGPITQDYASLELDLLARVAEIEANKGFVEVCISLLQQTHPHELESMYPTKDVIASSEHYRLFLVVKELRKVAWKVAKINNLREYYWSLLFECLRALDSVWESYGSWPRAMESYLQKICILASLICQRLERWNVVDWFPDDFSLSEWANEEFIRAHQEKVREIEEQISYNESRIFNYGDAPPEELIEQQRRLKQELERLTHPFVEDRQL